MASPSGGDSRLGDFSTMPVLAYRSPPFVGEHACRRVVAESERLRYVTVSTLSNPTLHRSHPAPPHTPPADPLASPHEAGRRLPDLVRRPGDGRSDAQALPLGAFKVAPG